MTNKMPIFARTFFTALAILLVGYILQANIAPLGATSNLSSDIEEDNIKLVPPTRVTQLPDTTLKQFDDLIYFSTDMMSKFDKAKIKITFKNPDPDQEISLGFQDQETYHYDSRLIDAPILNGLAWNYIGDKPRLYQKNFTYNSYRDFLTAPPKKEVIGFYGFDPNLLKQTFIADYSPSSKETIIDTPLRGKVVFYVYVNNELFKLWVSKQDLNWYEDPDPVKIQVYKENDVVYSATIDDDGIIDASRQVQPPLETYIQNPGPGLPEPGAYKVVIDTSADNMITQIKTTMHKIVFDSPLYIVSNSEIYPQIIEQTLENKLYSNALVLSAQTVHSQGLQEIKIMSSSLQDNSYNISKPNGGSVLKLTEVKKEESTASAEAFSEITIPKSDVILKGLLGYFAFSKEQFFTPSKFKLLPITEKGDIDAVDYIITNYKPSHREGEWRVAEAEFDLTSAFVKNGKLSWLIKAPGLKENGREVIIKKIEVELTKKPLIKF